MGFWFSSQKNYIPLEEEALNIINTENHDPDTCPICRQLNQLLRSHFVLTSVVILKILSSFSEAQAAISKGFISKSFKSIIPRAPPFLFQV